MGLLLLRVVLLFALMGFVLSDLLISDGVLQTRSSLGRSLLQAKKNCPVNFEFMNYTIITSQCKGPAYPAKQCCSALKDFACPYAAELNDLSNDCATTMFSYINLFGKYPPGLFSNECKEGKLGLACPPSSSPAADDTSSAHRSRGFLSIAAFAASVLVA